MAAVRGGRLGIGFNDWHSSDSAAAPMCVVDPQRRRANTRDAVSGRTIHPS